MRSITILTLLLAGISAVSIAQSTGKKSSSFFDQAQHSSRNSSTFTYLLTYTSEAYSDLTNPVSVNNDALWDDPEYTIPVSFPFELNGHNITSLQFAGVGFILQAPTTDPDIFTAVFPFEMDLIDRGVIIDDSQSPISYLVEGDPGSQILKVEIKNAGSYTEFESGTQNMFINIQLWLYEGSNQIEFRFGDHLINNPDLFFGGEGTYMGLTDININSGEIINGHFFTGDMAAPALSASDVTIEGTPDNGAVYTLSVTVPLDVTISSVNATSTCAPNGEATAIVTGGTEPFNYQWSTGDTTATITGLDAGTYTVTVTDSEGAVGIANTVLTNADPISPNASATEETSSDANDGTAMSLPTGGSGSYTFLWSNGETTSSITGLSPGFYTVTVTDGEGCTAEQTVIVNAFECMGLEIIAQVTDARCFGSCDGIIEITDITGGTFPYIYLWSTGEDTAIASDLCAGSYTVTVVDAAGCEVSGQFFVNEAEEFFVNAGATGESGPNANDGTAWAAPSGNFGPYSYVWSNMSTDSLITALSPGVYAVTVTDSNGCTAEESIEVFPFICFGEVTFIAEPISCAGACDGAISAVIINGGVGPFTFLWSNGQTTSTIENLCAGGYDVTITDIGQGCTIEGSRLLNSPPLLLLFVNEVIHVTDSTSGAIFIAVSGGAAPYSYSWTGPNGFMSAEKDISGLVPGIYVVQVVDANGCIINKTIEILDETVGIYTLNDLEITVYPNPARDMMYIQSKEPLADFSMELISPEGRKIGSWNSVYAIDISGYSQGIYFLKCRSGEKHFIHRFSILR